MATPDAGERLSDAELAATSELVQHSSREFVELHRDHIAALIAEVQEVLAALGVTGETK